MTLRKFGLVLGLLALLGGSVSAQTFRTERPAYVFGEPISFVIQGVPAEHDIDIFSQFRPDNSPPPSGGFGWQGGIISDPRGIVKGRMPAPLSDDGVPGTYVFEARDPKTGAYLARTSVRVVPIAVTGEREPFSDGRIEIDASGFFAVNSLYMHYVYQPGGGHANKLMKTVKLGPIDPFSGGLSRSLETFPFKPVPAGNYLVQFDGFQVYEDMRDAAPSAERPYVIFEVQRP